MLEAAKKKLDDLNRKRSNEFVDFLCLDLMECPSIMINFDLISLMSALHWLYPREKEVFHWIHEILKPQGTLCFTSYHPTDGVGGYGGTDLLVMEALKRIGLHSDFAAKQVPIGTRTRSLDQITACLNASGLRTEYSQTRVAPMKVSSAGDYTKYHLGTFGRYYAPLVDEELFQDLLASMDQIALERMSRYGYVTQMNVNARLCVKA